MLVTHRRQFTGGVCAGMSMRVRTVGHNFSVLVRQKLWGEVPDLIRRDIQRSRNMRLLVLFRSKRFDYRRFFPLQLASQVFCRNCRVHVTPL